MSTTTTDQLSPGIADRHQPDLTPVSTPTHRGAIVADVGIAGLGYVGLTLAAAFVRNGVSVAGWDVSVDRIESLRRCEVDVAEPGLADVVRTASEDEFSVSRNAPDELPETVFLCVGTPADPASNDVDFTQLDSALDHVADRMRADTLIIVRSTVPVGTTANRVRARLARVVEHPLVAFSPERTIQGQALAELEQLPQVVGADDPETAERARQVLARLNPNITILGATAAAELVKLVNNAHTDVIYGFGNEVALMAERLGVDADEVIRAANADYPRPDLARPGFVGGSCLTKDPYLLAQSLRSTGFTPRIIPAARSINESIPHHVAARVLDELRCRAHDPASSSVLLCGLAYKGRPATDDTRGAALPVIYDDLRDQVGRLAIHDFVVPEGRWPEFARIDDLSKHGNEFDVIVIVNNHPGYAASGLERWIRRNAIVYDLWGVGVDALRTRTDITYLRLGHG